MDSFRLRKVTGSGSKSPSGNSNNNNEGVGSGGITIGMKFNAGEEIIEDIIKIPYEHQQQQTPPQNQSLLTSPLQNIEDFNWRKEILQGGFFNRKRSNSIEGNKSGGVLSSSTSSSILNSSTQNQTNSTSQITNEIESSGSSTISSSHLVNTSINNSNNDSSASVGTWKLIKGKVSQAMEDIKSSKTSQSQQQQQHQQKENITNDDSDGCEIASNNSSESVTQLNLDPTNNITSISNTSTIQTITSTTLTGYSLPSLKTQHKYFNFNRRNNKSDTDSEDENEPSSVVEDMMESSSLRKSFANLRTKAKTHLSGGGGGGNSVSSGINISDSSNISGNMGGVSLSLPCSSSSSSSTSQSFDTVTTNITSIATSITTPIVSTSSASINLGSGIRSTFLRKRSKKQSPDVVSVSTSMLLTSLTNIEKEQKQSQQQQEQEQLSFSKKNKKEFEIESGVEMFEDTELPNINIEIKHNIPNIYKNKDSNKKETFVNENINKDNMKNYRETIREVFLKFLKNSNFLLSSILFIILIAVPIAEFFRGVIACLCILTFFNTFSEYFWNILNEKIKNISINYFGSDYNEINKKNNIIGPQRCKFEIPDYSKMGVLEIPPIEEHKPLKVYSGWMNEINNYDPNNFHQTMLRSVYIRLDGSILRILNTSTKIAKRSIWNENPIDKKNIIFTCSRTFNLIHAKVEMLPRGLARKRYFSRKYPIQLIIKNYKNQTFPNDDSIDNISSLDNKIDDVQILEKNDLIDDNQDTINLLTQNSKMKSVNITPDSNRNVTHQSSNESNDESRSNNFINEDQNNCLDFGTTVLSSDLQKLQDTQDLIALKETLPYGDETRVLLFARCDREKEDWYRRFYAASIGAIHDQDLRIPDIVMITDEEVSQVLKAESSNEISLQNVDISSKNSNKDDKDEKQQLPNQNSSNNINITNINNNDNTVPIEEASVFEGLLLSADAARNPPEYIKFMTRYQKACIQNKIPVAKSSLIPSETPTKKNRRQKRQEDELWKGINQSLYLGPSGSIVWANVLIGRILFSCLNDSILLEKIQDFLQRKLSAIRLPSFMEDVSIAHINLGDTPPLIHRISQPQLDERGTWIDADVTYEGLVHMTITTKLNLLRLKRSRHRSSGGGGSGICTSINTSSSSSGQQHHQMTFSALNMADIAASSIPKSSSSTTNDRTTDRAACSTNVITSSSGGNITSIGVSSTTPTSSSNTINNLSSGISLGAGSYICDSVVNLNSNYISSTSTTLNSSITSSVNGDEKLNQLSTTSLNLNINDIENSSTTTTLIGNTLNTNLNSDNNSQNSLIINSAIYDSNAESSGASSSESESPTSGSTLDITQESQSFHSSPGSSKRFLRIVDRITASNIFQSATEISYIQRAMENMSTKITLRVELKGLVSRVVVNIPPPPSDRIWLAFRGPPRLWISAKPAVGDHAFDWSVVTNVIENKLCDEVYKYLVYPNMVDIIVPFLGQSTYKE